MVSVRCDAARLKAWLAGLALLASVAGCSLVTGDANAAPVPGVTERPCPSPVNEGNGCIYLGTLSDLSTGPFRALGVPVTHAQRAFWDRVNRDGGIGGYDIDVTTYVRDTGYDPRRHLQAYLEIKDRVLALAQTLGTATTEEILGDLRAARMLGVPASFSSRWEFEDVMLESGPSYCFHAMNAIDYMVREHRVRRAMSVHFAGDYGKDTAAGARVAARANGLRFREVETPPGEGAQRPAVREILRFKPDVVMVSAGPAETAAIVAQASAAGYRGRFAGEYTTWHWSVLRTPAGAAMKKHFYVLGSWKPFATDAPGYAAMRGALGRVRPDDTFTAGWILSYPLKAVLERAAKAGELNREGLYRALRQTTFVDYEGIMPEVAGNFAGTANTAAFRQSVVARPDDRQYTGLKVLTDYFTGPTARAYRLDAPCSQS
ncbi:ABC transporter substrate-binding protein [Actinomadura flavalba]|uniref:ABC transporter substrate-binding protein n=1 Tax=Actinomadura flavalba TaxID=1120938 RepID=UPI00036F2F7D|nr:ABC transporter substrate-binding protein [Actinomadura flavalba]